MPEQQLDPLAYYTLKSRLLELSMTIQTAEHERSRILASVALPPTGRVLLNDKTHTITVSEE